MKADVPSSQCDYQLVVDQQSCSYRSSPGALHTHASHYCHCTHAGVLDSCHGAEAVTSKIATESVVIDLSVNTPTTTEISGVYMLSGVHLIYTCRSSVRKKVY